MASPNAINNNGPIVGVALPNTVPQEFIFDSAGVTTEPVLPDYGAGVTTDAAAVPATALNQGQAVGEATINGVDYQGEFSGDSTTDPSNELGASTLTGINNSGQIVGYGGWVPGLTGINNSGQIVGYGGSASGPVTNSSTCQPGTGGYSAFACGGSYGITMNNGQILNNNNSIFIASPSAPLPTSTTASLDNGVLNSLPTLGGTSSSTTSNSGGTPITLNNVVPSPPNSGVVIESTTGINDQGQIVGNGIYGGGIEGFLQPTDDPPALPEPRMTWGVLLAGCCGVFILRRKSGKKPALGPRA